MNELVETGSNLALKSDRVLFIVTVICLVYAGFWLIRYLVKQNHEMHKQMQADLVRVTEALTRQAVATEAHNRILETIRPLLENWRQMLKIKPSQPLE